MPHRTEESRTLSLMTTGTNRTVLVASGRSSNADRTGRGGGWSCHAAKSDRESEKHRLRHVHPSEVPPLSKMGKNEAHQDAKEEEAESQPRPNQTGQASLRRRLEDDGPNGHGLL
ncbi:hypothetical protein MMC29_007606 [Sticta canariensis]|nr:hypothetical protein [Sticta canariensis]